jgi:hypothetical protein
VPLLQEQNLVCRPLDLNVLNSPGRHRNIP